MSRWDWKCSCGRGLEGAHGELRHVEDGKPACKPFDKVRSFINEHVFAPGERDDTCMRCHGRRRDCIDGECTGNNGPVLGDGTYLVINEALPPKAPSAADVFRAVVGVPPACGVGPLNLMLPMSKLKTIHELHATTCEDAECLICGVLSCPEGEPMHFHHDGCPACPTPECSACGHPDHYGPDSCECEGCICEGPGAP